MAKLLPTILLLALAPPALAGTPAGELTLFAASKGNHTGGAAPSTLYTVDPASGVVTPVGPIGFESVTGMTFLPDHRLLATATVDAEGQAILIEIDPATGSGSLIGTLSDVDDGVGCARMPGLAYDPSTGRLFGWGDFCNGSSIDDLFFFIEEATARTIIHDPAVDGCGNSLAVDPADATLYSTSCTGGQNLHTVDKATGVLTAVPNTGGPGFPAIQAGADFHPISGLLYSIHYDSSALDGFLVSIDPSQEPPVQNVIGQMRDAADAPIDGFDALAFRFTTPADCRTIAPSSCNVPTAEKKAKLSLDPRKGKLSFAWKKGGATTKEAFAMPTVDTPYALCIYDTGVLVAGYRIPPDAELWKDTKKGFKYKNKDAPVDGITSVKLKEGPAGKASVTVKGKGVTLPPLPFASGPDVTVQLVAELGGGAGNCWSASFGPSYTRKNDADGFKAKSETLGLED